MANDIKDILDFWLNDVGPEGWYVASDDVDDQIRRRFSDQVAVALSGGFDEWTETPEGTLALLVLLDQFPRNLYRGSKKAFAGDARALDIARLAVCNNVDLETSEPGRQFFYLPFEHSESLADQEWSVALFKSRMSTLTDETMGQIEKHREMIVRFGRFPFRNEALGRKPTPEETEYYADGGYAPGIKL